MEPNTNEVMLVVLMRLYDVSLAQLAAVDKETAIRLKTLHENGKIATELPWFAPDDEEVTDE